MTVKPTDEIHKSATRAPEGVTHSPSAEELHLLGFPRVFETDADA